ncbi:MAG: Ger(x)C family spore germination protein [Bacillota bacterium]
MKRKVCLILVCTLFLVGCWDRKELKEIGTVVAVGLDKDPNTGKVLFTAQIIRPGALAKDGGTQESPIEIVSSSGNTVFEAIRNSREKLDRKYHYFHTKIIVIGEALAKEGVMPILDTFTRGKEMRGYVWLAVTQEGVQAREIVGVKSKIENIQASYLKNVIENKEFHAGASTSDFMTYYIKSLENGIEPIIGVLKMIEEQNFPVENRPGKTTRQVKFSGVAAFKDDKLVGFLNKEEAQGLNWIIGEVKSRVFTMPSLIEEDKLISIEVIRANSHIEPKIKGGNISFIINVEQEGSLVEQQSMGNITEPKEIVDYLKKVEEKNEELIKKEIEMAVNKAQEEINSDIFGFGDTLNKKYPKKWEEVKDKWDDLFPNVDYEVKVNVEIIRTDFMQGTFKQKD